jgi:hypothetical protein
MYWVGAGLGFLAGAVVGGAVGYLLTQDDSELPGIGAVLGAPIGGGVGIVVGGVVGATRSGERWETLRLPIGVGLRPSADSFALFVKVPLR